MSDKNQVENTKVENLYIKDTTFEALLPPVPKHYTMHNVRIAMRDGTAQNATIYALDGESAEKSIQKRYPQYHNAMQINTLRSERLSTDMFAFPDILKGA